MTSARHLAMKTALSAITIALGLQTVAIAAPTTGEHRLTSAVAQPATARFRVLHSFHGADGSAPEGSLDLAVDFRTSDVDGTFYGETEGGGAALSGTLYTFTLDSNKFRTLYEFSGGIDGGSPVGGLAHNATNYFPAGAYQLGVTNAGGAGGAGTVFAVGAHGKLLIVHAFSGGADGANPAGRITRFTDGNYYGTTTGGGKYNYGTIYRITPSGAFSTVYAFTGGTDGGSPLAGLALRVDVGGDPEVTHAATVSATVEQLASASSRYVSPYLYGTTSTAGTNGAGTIFRITPAGRLETLYAFSGNLDGGSPAARLSTDLHGNLYGSTTVGGSGGNGVIFKLKREHTTPRVVYDFGNGATGAAPSAALTLGFDGIIYGTTARGGASGQYGTIFQIEPDGRFGDIHNFAGTDGANPQGALVDGGDGYLYGTAVNGGAYADGVIFSIRE